MRPLKIAHLSRWYWEENRRTKTEAGGPVQQLAEAMAALGHEVVVFSQSPDVRTLEKSWIGPLETWLSPREKKRDFLTGLRDKWAKRTYHYRKLHTDALALRDFLARRGPFDAIWTQGEEPDGLVCGFARELGFVLPPVLIQMYALRYRFEKGSPVFEEKPALRCAFRHAERILANSEMVASSLPAYEGDGLSSEAIAAKTWFVPPNLQGEFFTAAKAASPQPSEKNRVLFLGALNEKKGALVFMDAVRKTAVAKSDAIFAVIGGFTEKNADFTRRWDESVVAAHTVLSAKQLELLGKVPPDKVIRQIQRASVVVLPSLFDEFSRALIETLILGRPVVTTKTVGAWPLVEKYNCGRVVEPNDSSALAHAIDEALAPDAPYAANARQIASQLSDDYTPEVIARSIAQHLEEIVPA